MRYAPTADGCQVSSDNDIERICGLHKKKRERGRHKRNEFFMKVATGLRLRRPKPSPAHAPRTQLIAIGLPVALYILLAFTVSSGSDLVFGIPRILIILLVGSGLFSVCFPGRLSRTPMRFIVAYLVAMTPGTIFSLVDGKFLFASFAQLLLSICGFVVIYSKTSHWLANESPRRQLRQIDTVITIAVVSSALELIFPSAFAQIRASLYSGAAATSYQISVNRDSDLYGFLRPAGIFSEVSNFARVISIFTTARLIITKGRFQSICVWIAFALLTRSPSYFFTFPILIAWLASFRTIWDGSTRRINVYQIGGIVGGVTATLFLFVTQLSRIGLAAGGHDGSLNSRVVLPISYLQDGWASPLIGDGATPQRPLEGYVLQHLIERGRIDLIEVVGFREGSAPAIMTVAGLGIAGMVIFFALLWGLGYEALFLGVLFFLFNFMTAGFNSPAEWLPLSVGMAVAIHVWRRNQPR